MKNRFSILIFVFLLLIANTTFAKNTQYPTTKINGENYIVYIVEAGEGLFGIARKFEVTQDEIIKINAGIKDGLKVGEEILIPYYKKSSVKLSSTSKTDQKQIDFIYHKVEKKQTLFAISRKYKVDEEEIISINPFIKNGLLEGSIIKIPKNADKKESAIKKVEVEKEKSSAEPTYKTHTVKADETLYSISKEYKVSVADIIELNPGSANTLEINTELKIPTTIQNAGSKVESNTGVTSIPNQLLHQDTKKVIQIAYLLPFMTSENQQDQSVKKFIEFYSGSLIAIQRAKERGISCEIYTFDTEKSEQKMMEVLSNTELKKMDLIIGPAYSIQIPLVSDFAKEHKINTLIPFSSKVTEIDTNPYLFQFNPGSANEIKFTFELLTTKYASSNIIFAQIPGISSFDEGKVMSDALQKNLTKKGIKFSKIELSTPEISDFKTVLKSGKENIVIFNTDKYSFAHVFFPSLRSHVKQFDIVLFEQFNWKNQKEKMPSSIYVSAFMGKSNQKELSDYNKQYIKLINNDISKESPRFDLLGFDLSNYFISIINRYGDRFIDKVSTTNITNCIQSQPIFERISNESGFYNQRLYLTEDK